jgi:hypothetical protein
MEFLHPDSALIDQLGSTSAVAAMFSVRPQAVSQWRRHGIPAARRQTMVLMRPEVFAPSDAREGERRVEPSPEAEGVVELTALPGPREERRQGDRRGEGERDAA